MKVETPQERLSLAAKFVDRALDEYRRRAGDDAIEELCFKLEGAAAKLRRAAEAKKRAAKGA